MKVAGSNPRLAGSFRDANRDANRLKGLASNFSNVVFSDKNTSIIAVYWRSIIAVSQ